MTVEAELLQFIRAQLAPAADTEVTLDTDLIGEGVLDSTDVMKLVLWIPQTYGFSVETRDMTPEHFGTVRRLVKYVEQRAAHHKSPQKM